MAELVDALGLGSSVFMTWRFKSSQRHLGSVAESVDAPDLKSVDRMVVRVQVSPFLLNNAKG